MKHIKKFNEVNEVNEAKRKPITFIEGTGEYPIEEFDAFMRELIDVTDWSNEAVPKWKQTTFSLPSKSGRHVSSVSTSKEEAIEKWEEALKTRGTDKNTVWYVWHADIGGSMNKPKQYSTQRYDIESILDIARKYPDAVRKINVSMDSVEQKDFTTMMTSKEYGGKPGRYTGD